MAFRRGRRVLIPEDRPRRKRAPEMSPLRIFVDFETKIDESQALHRLVFESSRDVLSVFGTDGLIRLVSPSVEGILGYDPREVVGLSTMWASSIPTI